VAVAVHRIERLSVIGVILFIVSFGLMIWYLLMTSNVTN
jgi:hypothetical protein